MKSSSANSGTFALSFRGESFTLQPKLAQIVLAFSGPTSLLLLGVSLECRLFDVSLGDDMHHTYHPAFVVEELTVPSTGPMPWQSRIARHFAYSESDEIENDQPPGYIQFNHHQSVDRLAMQIEWDGKGFMLTASGDAEMDTTFHLSVPAVARVEVSIRPDRMATLGLPSFSDEQLAKSQTQEQYWLATPDVPDVLLSEFASHFDPNDFEIKLAQNTNHKWWQLSANPREVIK